ncbi:MAG: DUF58 domain-containing protein [Hyphomicrobiaceae bacterium]
MAEAAYQSQDSQQADRWNRPREEAEGIAAALPPLLVSAERLASGVWLGVHGRRKAGMGETFWQFRRYRTEDPSTVIDWRQSAKTQHLYVREREWEAAETVWFWRDGSLGMRYASNRNVPEKWERATVLALALGSLLVRGGERIGVLGASMRPAAGRIAMRRVAHQLAELPLSDADLPPELLMKRHCELVWLSDFLQPLDEIESHMKALAYSGAHGYLVQIIDPAEEDFPFTGRARFEAHSIRDTTILGRAEMVRSSYRQRYDAHAEAVKELARRLGWVFLRHRTDRSPGTALIALYGALGGARAQRGF